MTAAIVFTVLSLLAATLAVGVWVAVSLISVGLISLGVFRSMPVDKLLAQTVWTLTTPPALLAPP
ncbi:MAG: C4-dicarboxylate ABC transporter permease, partial [Alphaproteobacteria bacterium]|nr:C4-dicarboxylate ABC transporter permease [Alphaproteobacteria bacterium]